jgi:hypothetical protein
MALVSCPPLLKKLIKRVNSSKSGENDALRLIARAFAAKRQKKRIHTVAVQTSTEIIISLQDGTFRATNELIQALDEIESPNHIELIRECRRCPVVFWAGRADKEACDKHLVAWRKQRQRAKALKAETQRQKKKALLANKPLRWSKRSNTTKAVISAIMNQRRVFWRIDNWVVSELRWQLKAPVTNRRIVRQCLNALVKEDFLTYHPHPQDEDSDEPRDPLEDRWAPTQKLRNRLAGVRPKPSTH